jgi:tRNA pseudouridine55 synthase
MYSAKKVAGERLYRAARQGRTVERQPVKVTIHSIEAERIAGRLLSINEDGTADMRVVVSCSSGTYVRTLAFDIGERLGVGGHLAELRRTAVGRFTVEKAINLEGLQAVGVDELEGLLISPSELVGHFRMVRLDAGGVRRVLNGREVAVEAGIEGLVRLCDQKGSLVAIAEANGFDCTAHPKVVLPADALMGE